MGCRVLCDTPLRGVLSNRWVVNPIKPIIWILLKLRIILFKIDLICYGYDCEFEVSGKDSEVIKQFQKHSSEEHGIEHSTEGLYQLILRMRNS